MNTAIILAGGTGSRIGASVPKQFLEIQRKPILAYTLAYCSNEVFISVSLSINDGRQSAHDIRCHKRISAALFKGLISCSSMNISSGYGYIESTHVKGEKCSDYPRQHIPGSGRCHSVITTHINIYLF